jgi:5-methylcytosine-specific restriction protein A
MPRLKQQGQLRKGKRKRCKEAADRRWRIRMLVRQSGGRCRYCQRVVARDLLTIDHMVPLSAGGLDIPENLALACHPCNQSKGSGIAIDLYVSDGFGPLGDRGIEE